MSAPNAAWMLGMLTLTMVLSRIAVSALIMTAMEMRYRLPVTRGCGRLASMPARLHAACDRSSHPQGARQVHERVNRNWDSLSCAYCAREEACVAERSRTDRPRSVEGAK